MFPITHLDGSDVVVIDCQGRHVPAVEEVRVEPGLAVVCVNTGARAWLHELVARASEESLACAVRSRDGQQLHHCGLVRVVCA